MAGAKTNANVLRNLPSVDEVLGGEAGREYAASAGTGAATGAVREILERLRADLSSGAIQAPRAELRERIEAELRHRTKLERLSGVQGVVNATGVVIHTNLGRAPLSDQAKQALFAAAGYCTLEYDIETGKRGRRGSRVEALICELTDADDAVVVNNGAAAAFFVLTALASGGEVVISRGELVEIGGDFRIPDVLAASGATLKEVGTTNRTKLADYATAVGNETRMILRVHPSNFRILGFTASASREDLSALARERGLVFYEDLGSGALVDLSPIGLSEEPTVAEAIAAGVDIVSFSGDKLLGGPQAGIIAGRKELIDRIRTHPLFRVLRPDKLVYAALEATLAPYRKESMFEEVPVLSQLSASAEPIGERAARILAEAGSFEYLRADIVDGSSAVGGGAGPGMTIPTKLISLTHSKLSAQQLEHKLRMNDVPVIARIEADVVLIDLRTVSVDDETVLMDAIRNLDGQA
ncbi:MAG: L-seryl-tRNA(Sec) selenium transferase [Acidobacteria bacterium]|nr:L-seryl-tRNA(Sec) selenium transferase [Acidobacteriota bacterium]